MTRPIRFSARRGTASAMLAFAVITTGMAVAVFAADAAKLWTTVGSAGTVDANDLSIFTTNDRNISVMAAPDLPATLDVRYNIVAVDGLVPADSAGTSIFMKARYRDLGGNGQIVLRLKRYNLNTGATTTLLTLDSNAFAQSSSAQVRKVSTEPCVSSVKFDFVNNAYFVDAQLIQASFNSVSELPPLLAIIQVGAGTAPCPPS
jgi:predicted transposase YbfD/YdcC